MNILDPIFYCMLFYDFRQWIPWGPPILARQAKKPNLNNLTLLFVYDNLRINKTWGDFVLMLINQGLASKPTISSA
jgi:hypothetical protein